MLFQYVSIHVASAHMMQYTKVVVVRFMSVMVLGGVPLS
jgi:hypothetical protein